MQAKGTFNVELTAQTDDITPVGRMLIDKQYTGDMVGKGIGQMISKRTTNGAAAYSAIEEFSGSLAGKTGTFTFIHNGLMSATEQQLTIYILQGSGTGELTDITGQLTIIQSAGQHSYELTYQFN
jgi:hypothetical protein